MINRIISVMFYHRIRALAQHVLLHQISLEDKVAIAVSMEHYGLSFVMD